MAVTDMEKENVSISPGKNEITFLMVGCQRCGSTWTYEALKEHPEVYLPDSKQTHFFDESFENGMGWYLEHFDGISDKHIAVGEVATSYCLPEVIPKVASELPDIKIIMAMRGPVERAYSYYRSRAPHEDWKNFEDALLCEPEITARGQYIDQIEILLQHYNRKEILFLVYDDLKTDERAYIRSVYSFLGVNPDFEPSVIGNPVRAAMFPKTRKALRKMGLTPLVNLINKSVLGDGLRRCLRNSRQTKSKPAIHTETHQRLADHFQPYNKRLEAFLERKLESW